jgi:hypothetical protein
MFTNCPGRAEAAISGEWKRRRKVFAATSSQE